MTKHDIEDTEEIRGEDDPTPTVEMAPVAEHHGYGMIACEGMPVGHDPGTVWGREAIESMHKQLKGSKLHEEGGLLQLWTTVPMGIGTVNEASFAMSIGASQMQGEPIPDPFEIGAFDEHDPDSAHAKRLAEGPFEDPK